MSGHDKIFERKAVLQMIRRKSQLRTQESGENVLYMVFTSDNSSYAHSVIRHKLQEIFNLRAKMIENARVHSKLLRQ